MLVRRKYLCFAFCARRDLRYCVDGVTVLAPEAEAPRILRLEALWSCSSLKQKGLLEAWRRYSPGRQNQGAVKDQPFSFFAATP